MKIPRLMLPSLILAATLLGCGTVLAQQKTVLKETEMKDLAELRARADQGDADAQYILGLMYDRGLGVAKDEVEAVKWYLLAGAQGNEWAKTAIPIIEKVLTPAQRAEGRKRVSEFNEQLAKKREGR
ncbi:MAG: sel1 repeat family protein [Pedosphaera sp.]|nr:sel1 repeat family protein [Pedosphaera sp.]